MRNISIAISIFISSLFVPFSVRASADVLVSSDVFYQFSPSGNCQAIHNIRLTNGPTHVYPSSFQLDIAGSQPEEISVSNSAGPLKFNLQTLSPVSYRIIAYLTVPVVGKGNSQDISIKYLCPPANKHGQNWEISLPQAKDIDSFSNYQLHIQVPESFGKLAFINSPLVSSQPNEYVLGKSQLGNSPVSAVFGQSQVYDFSLAYNLYNPSHFAKQFIVPLPPDTSYQKIYLNSLKPLPENVQLSPSGNWLANIVVPARSSARFVAVGQAYILPSASFLSVYASQKQTEREVLGFLDNKVIVWDEHWDSAQSTWYAPEFTPSHFYISTLEPGFKDLLSAAQLSLSPSAYQNHVPSNPEASLRFPLQLLPFVSNRSEIVVANTQPQALYWVPVSAAATSIKIVSPAVRNISVIPPFGKVAVPLDFQISLLPSFSPHFLSLRIGTSLVTYNIPEYLFIFWYVAFILIISAVFICMAWLAVRSWSLHLQRLKREDHLRWQSQKPQK